MHAPSPWRAIPLRASQVPLSVNALGYSLLFLGFYTKAPSLSREGPGKRAGIDPQIFIEIRNRKIRLRLSPVPYCRAFASLLAADGTVRLFLTGRVLQ